MKMASQVLVTNQNTCLSLCLPGANDATMTSTRMFCITNSLTVVCIWYRKHIKFEVSLAQYCLIPTNRAHTHTPHTEYLLGVCKDNHLLGLLSSRWLKPRRHGMTSWLGIGISRAPQNSLDQTFKPPVIWWVLKIQDWKQLKTWIAETLQLGRTSNYGPCKDIKSYLIYNYPR